MEDKFYTISDLAAIFKVDKRKISSLIKNKRLQAVNIGTEKRASWRIFEGQYRKFLAESYNLSENNEKWDG